ncbi:MAG: DNA-directed RNA polymerase subunit omega [Firmicutes bacterium]|nr:DNA-directed RNA polymerase subunit omega [Bacillota bacterium]
MIEPSFDDLLQKTDSKYTLVIAAAKRARQLLQNDTALKKEGKAVKPVSLALREIAAGKLRCERKR